MGVWKALGRGAKRLPWKKIAKYGAAAVGVPAVAIQSGANEEVQQLTDGGLSPVVEHALIVAEAVLGLIAAWLRERASKNKQSTLEE